MLPLFPRISIYKLRAFSACLLSFLMLTAPIAPLGASANGHAPHTSGKSTSEEEARTKMGAGLSVNPLSPLAPFFLPIITATLADDITLANKKDPGATITYTATISNTGSDASNVVYTDTLDSNTTLVVGSIKTTPIAFDDAYNVVGNVRIQPNAAAGLLVNDIDPDTGNNTGLLATAQTISSTNCAACNNVTINADGSFSYNPPVGFQGSDTFTYTVNDPTGKTGTGTVTLTVSGIVWFINNNSAACTTLTIASGCGRLTNPFSTLASFNGFNDGGAGPPTHPKTNDNIFIFESASNYIGPVTLLGGQKLFGQDSTATLQTLTGLTPQAYSDPFPAMNTGAPATTLTSGSTTIFLNNTTTSNNLNGFTVGTSTTTGINGLNFGTLNVGSVILNTSTGQALALNNGTVAIPANYTGFTSTTSTGGTNNVSLTTIAGTVNLGSGALSGAGGNGLNVSGGAAAINFSGTISNSTARQVSIISKTGGTVALSGAVSGTGTGIFLNSNTGATINFTGGVVLGTGASDAFTATGGGTVSVTGAANTLTSTTGTALNVANTTIGASGLTFLSISSNGGSNGIILNNTGASGSLTVTGTVASVTNDGSGGTIQNKTGAEASPVENATLGVGIYLNSTKSPSFNHMNLHDFSNYAIAGTSVNGFTMTYSTINGVNGTGANRYGGFGEGSVMFQGLLTSATFDHSNFSGGANSTFTVLNNSSQTLNRATFTFCSFAQTDTTGNDALVFQGTGGTLNVTVQDSTFTAARGDLFQIDIHGTISSDLIFGGAGHGNTLSNSNTNSLGGGITLGGGGAGNVDTFTFNISNNTMQGAKTGAISIGAGTGAGTNHNYSGTINANTIGDPVTANSGSFGGSDIFFNFNDAGTANVSITNNFLYQYNNEGINLNCGVFGSANSYVQATVTGNTISNPGTFASQGFLLTAGTGPALPEKGRICLTLGGAGALANKMSGSGVEGAPAFSTDIRVRDRFDVTIGFPGYGGSTTDTAALGAYLAGRNSGDGVPTTSVAAPSAGTTNGTTNGFFQTCPPPLLLAMGGISSASDMFPMVQGLDFSQLSAMNVATPTTAASTVSSSLNQPQLDSIVTAAVERWSATWLTAPQISILRAIKFDVANLGGSYLGQADGNRILVDRNAGGKGWYTGADSSSDTLFNHAVSLTRRYTDPASAPAGHVDLLTAIEHEMGHRLGLDDSYLEKDRDSIMYGYLTVGERRVPAIGQARAAQPGALTGSHFLSLRSVPAIQSQKSDQKVTPQSGETITVNGSGGGFTLPAGKTITITYQATVNSPPFAKSVSTQGHVAYTGGPGGGVPTDDPETGAAGDATVTNINTTSTWTGLTSPDWNTATNWNPNTYAPGVSNPAVNDVVIPGGVLPNEPTISATDIGVFSLNVANGRTLTIQSLPLRILTIGAPAAGVGGDLTVNGIISGGQLNFGTGSHNIINGGTGSISSTNLTTVLSGSSVTLNNNLQMGSLQVNSGGTMIISNTVLSLNGPGAALVVQAGATFTPAVNGDGESLGTTPGDGLQAVGSTVVYNGSVAQTGPGLSYSSLTINNAAGVTLTGDASLAAVVGQLTLTSGNLNMGNTGQFTLTVPNTLATLPANGTFDVVGSFKRTGSPLASGTALTFGNSNCQITLTGSTLTSLTVNMTKATPTAAFTGIANSGWPGSIQRTYLITPAGGAFTTSTLRLHYLDSELNAGVNPANVEGSLRLYKYVIASPSTGWQQQDPAGGVTTFDSANNWVQKTGVTSFSPWTIAGALPTATTSIVSGRILDIDGNPVEGAVVRLNGTQDRKTITDSLGNYSFSEVETNGFYTVTPSRVNFNFAPATRGFSALGAHTEASFGAAANGNHLNPLDTTEYFVRQQYVDFLGREPEEKGLNDWTDTINNCGDASCDRVHVSESFFRSEEFQQRGYFVYRFYSTAFGQKPDYTAFVPDLGRVSGFLDATQLEAAKTQFASDFTNRAAFVNQYGQMTNGQYVDALAASAGVTLSNRQALVNSLSAGTLTRAQALRQIAESGEVYSKYYNQAFVVMEYFGYLKRDPDSLYLNWISVLDANPADSRRMVEGFVDATEYRNRFPQ